MKDINQGAVYGVSRGMRQTGAILLQWVVSFPFGTFLMRMTGSVDNAFRCMLRRS